MTIFTKAACEQLKSAMATPEEVEYSPTELYDSLVVWVSSEEERRVCGTGPFCRILHTH